MKRLSLLLALILAPGYALAQSAPVQQNASRLDASTGTCAIATAVNATQAAGTCTITPPAGQYVYFNFLQVGACIDGTASQSPIQLNFTSTNLSGWTAETSWITGSTITTDAGVNLCGYQGGALTAPLKSAAPGVAVTIVPPAQTAHVSFPIIASYYFAP